MNEFKRRPALVALTALLGIAVVSVFFAVGKDEKMSTKVMMQYGLWSPEDRSFDASRWFSSGMYRQKMIGTPPAASREAMLRNKPLPVTARMNDDLAAIAGVALEYDYPEMNTESLLSHPPALSQRVRYWASKFEAPDKPVDDYNLFLNLGHQRFVIRFSLDGRTGELIDDNSARLINEDQPSDAEYLQVFKELDEAEKARG